MLREGRGVVEGDGGCVFLFFFLSFGKRSRLSRRRRRPSRKIKWRCRNNVASSRARGKWSASRS